MSLTRQKILMLAAMGTLGMPWQFAFATSGGIDTVQVDQPLLVQGQEVMDLTQSSITMMQPVITTGALTVSGPTTLAQGLTVTGNIYASGAIGVGNGGAFSTSINGQGIVFPDASTQTTAFVPVINQFTVNFPANNEYIGMHTFCALGGLDGGPHGGTVLVQPGTNIQNSQRDWYVTSVYYPSSSNWSPHIWVTCLN